MPPGYFPAPSIRDAGDSLRDAAGTGKIRVQRRKWLTYIALLIAAAVTIGDVATFLAYYLRGELSSRFAAKVAVVAVTLLISGGVFWYYLSSLREARRGVTDAR